MTERLIISLTIQVGTAAHAVPGGNVKSLSLSMSPYGVHGAIEFVLQDDKTKGGKYQDTLLADFVKPDLSMVTLSIEAAQDDTTVSPEKGLIETGGIVIERHVEEHVYSRVINAPAALARRYRITFCDPARALWSQHFPCDLFTQKSFADAITAHRGLVQVTFRWDVISNPVPLVFFHLDPDHEASFYDLVTWYVQSRQGVFLFDQKAQSYSIQATKDAQGPAVKVPAGDIAGLTSMFAPVPRYVPRVQCSYTESPSTTTLTNPNAAPAVFRDVLIRTPIAKQVDDRAALEKSRPLLPSREVSVTFRRFPTEAVLPNTLVALPSAGSTGPLAAPNEFRVTDFRLEARAAHQEVEADYGEPSTGFDVSTEARLETTDEKCVRLPKFTPPFFPSFIEGKVVSETGAADELTYQSYPDQPTSLDEYRIQIPLFQDQVVTAPYEPYSGSGALYLPLYKGERVLAAFEFDRVRIRELLDWRGEARVPLSGQGQQLFLGKTTKNNTSVLHDYQSNQPVFRILRTNETDTALFKLEEGKLTLKVEQVGG